MIRIEYGRSIRRRDWQGFARIMPRSIPMTTDVCLTIDPQGITVQSTSNDRDDEYKACRFLMDFFTQANCYQPIWILQCSLNASVQ